MCKAGLDLAKGEIARVLRPLEGSNWVVGVVGTLELEVIAIRIDGLETGFEPIMHETARWLLIEDEVLRKRFISAHRAYLPEDGDNALAYLARKSWEIERVQEERPDITFSAVRGRNQTKGAIV